MSEELKASLREQGFIITEKGHVMIMTILSLLIFLGGLFTLYAVNYSEKELIKKQVEIHEERIKETEKIVREFSDMQLEIKQNVKEISNKLGRNYTTNN